MADDRAIAYMEDDHPVFRASSIGRAARCLTAALLGYEPLPPPEYLVKAAEAGNMFENVVKAMLRDRGYRISGTQDKIEIAVGDWSIIRGHVDGWHVVGEDGVDRVLEVKSMSATVFAKWVRWGFEKFPEYAAQLTCYMKAADRPALYAVINRESKELLVMPVDTPPADFIDIANKVHIVEDHFLEKKLPVCDSTSQYPCPYSFLCDLRDEGTVASSGQSDKLLEELTGEYARLRAVEKQAKDQRTEVSEKIKAVLGDREELAVPGWKITHTWQKRRKLDETALRDELGGKLDGFYTESSYQVLRVSAVK